MTENKRIYLNNNDYTQYRNTVQNLDYDYGLMFENGKSIEVDSSVVEQKLKDGYE